MEIVDGGTTKVKPIWWHYLYLRTLCFCIEYTTWINLMSRLARRSSQATNPVCFSQHILKNWYLLSCLHYRQNEWINSVFYLMFSSTPPSTPTPTPAADTLFVQSNTQTMVLLCNAHNYNSFCLFPNSFLCQFHFTSSVNMLLSFLEKCWNGKRSALSLQQRRKNNTTLKR